MALGNLVAMVLFVRGKLHFGGSWRQLEAEFGCNYPMSIVDKMFNGLAFFQVEGI